MSDEFDVQSGKWKDKHCSALKPYFEGKTMWGVMEADIDSDVDANTLIEAGIPSIQLHTGGMCHLDADMTRQGIRAFDRAELDFVVLENIGNLVCPAEFDTGANFNRQFFQFRKETINRQNIR